jgi:hypothetical protein
MPRHNHLNPPPQNLPDETLIDMRKAGYSIQFIADKAGLNSHTLGSRFRKWGVVPEFPVMQPPRVDQSIYDRINHLYWDEGLTIAEVAKVLGYHPTVIRYHMVQGGIPRRDRSEVQVKAWERGRQNKSVPRGFIKLRLEKIEQEKNEKNNENDSADSVHN